MSKATDIIKSKNVKTEMLKQCKSVEDYNTAITMYCGLKLIDYKNRLLTQEEFDLLKEEQEIKFLKRWLNETIKI